MRITISVGSRLPTGQTGPCTLHRDSPLFTLRVRPSGERLASLGRGEIGHAPARSLRAGHSGCLHGLAAGAERACATFPCPSASGRVPDARGARRERAAVAHLDSGIAHRGFVAVRPSAPELRANPESPAAPDRLGAPALNDPGRDPQRGADPTADAASALDAPPASAADPRPLVLILGRVSRGAGSAARQPVFSV